MDVSKIAISPEEMEFIAEFNLTALYLLFESAPSSQKKLLNGGRKRELSLLIDNVSYAPTDIIYGTHVKRHLWEINPCQPLNDSVLFRNLRGLMEQRKTNELYDLPVDSFSHYDANGTFVVHDDALSPSGTLQLTSFSKGILTDALSAVSPYALTPRAHQITGIGNIFDENLSATFYTSDPDGSEWSIHCRPFVKQ